MSLFLFAVVIAVAGSTLYFAWRFRDVRKFLAGAFFVSGGLQLYLFVAKISLPVLGTALVQTPEVSAVRGAIHLALFAVCFATGFLIKPR